MKVIIVLENGLGFIKTGVNKVLPPMMIKMDYAAIVANVKAKGATSVDFDHTMQPVKAISSQQDTVTLSKEALALMNGNSIKAEEPAPTYIRPETASSLLAQNEVEVAPEDIAKQEKSQRFADVMQNIAPSGLNHFRHCLINPTSPLGSGGGLEVVQPN